ncbi:hypothetical protein HOY80DRAFT_896523, partial [Tuber brumale]
GLVSKPADFNLPLTELSYLSQPPSVWRLKFWYPPRKTDTHPTNTQPTLPIVLARYFITASFVCLLAFPIHVLPPLLPGILLFYK